jgi:hypothetical protein
MYPYIKDINGYELLAAKTSWFTTLKEVDL